VTPAIFAQLLKCCYTDEVEVDASNVQALLKVANKYEVDKLKIACRALLEGDVNKDNALDLFILGPAMLGQEDFGLPFIEENAEEIINTDAFLKLPMERLKVLLKSDKLAIEEIDLFKAVTKWVKSNEKKDGYDSKAVSKDVVSLIRFPILEVGDLASIVAPSGLIEQPQLVQLFSYCAVPAEARAALPKPPFPDVAREGGRAFAWDPVKKGRNVTFSNNNLTARASGSSWTGGIFIGNKVFTKGHQYWEVKIDNSQNDMIGVAAPDVNISGDYCYSNQPTKVWFVQYPGSTYGGTATGTVRNGSIGQSFTTGDTMGFSLVWDEKTKTYNMDIYRNKSKIGTPFQKMAPPLVACVEFYSSPAQVTLNSKAKKP